MRDVIFVSNITPATVFVVTIQVSVNFEQATFLFVRARPDLDTMLRNVDTVARQVSSGIGNVPASNPENYYSASSTHSLQQSRLNTVLLAAFPGGVCEHTALFSKCISTVSKQWGANSLIFADIMFADLCGHNVCEQSRHVWTYL